MTCVCETNADGISLCNFCCEALESVLRDVDEVDGELTRAVSAVSMTANYGPREGSGGGAQHAPAPLNVDALSARKELRDYVMNTALRVALGTSKPLAGRDVHALTNYLYTSTPWLRRQSFAPDILTQLQKLTHKGRTASQPRGERINVGQCGNIYKDVECTQPLNPLTTQTTIQCRTCGTTWNIRDRQRTAIQTAWQATAPPPVIIRALAAYGLTIKPKHLENWIQAGHLTHVTELAGRKQYRVSDVHAVATRMQARRKTA